MVGRKIPINIPTISIIIPKVNIMKRNIVDLFSGAGGLSYGFRQAGFNIVAGIDKEEEFIESFSQMHEDSEAIVADLGKNNVKELLNDRGIKKDDVDIIVGGPPCKGFSTVGDREKSDDRNKLVIKFADALNELEPAAFVMENVTGLKSMEDEDGNLVIDELEDIFEEYGYRIKYKVLEATSYGVPQKRKRLFIVGMKTDIDDFSWPKPTHIPKDSLEKYSDSKKDFYVTVDEAISDLPNLEAGEQAREYGDDAATEYQEEMRDGKESVLNHETPNHSEKIIERLSHVPQGGNHKDLPEEFQLSGGYSNIYGRLDPDKPADTITANFGCVSAPGKFIPPYNDRALTVREGARLQSFPDHYKFFGNQNQQYKQVGHAVPPLLAKSVGEQLKKTLNKKKGD